MSTENMNGAMPIAMNPASPTQVGVKMIGRWVQVTDGTFFHRDHIAGVLMQAMQSPLANGQMVKLPNKCVVLAAGQMVGVDMAPEKMIAWLDAHP